MSLFGMLPKIPPEFAAMLANPGAMKEQIKAFYFAGRGLIDAVEAQKIAANAFDGNEGDSVNALAEADERVWKAADAFKLEFERLPPLDKLT
jgi:hypothetical protein